MQCIKTFIRMVIEKSFVLTLELFSELKDITKVPGGILTSEILQERLEVFKKSHSPPFQLNGVPHSQCLFAKNMEIFTKNGKSSREISPLTHGSAKNIGKSVVNEAPNKLIEIKPEDTLPHATVTKVSAQTKS